MRQADIGVTGATGRLGGQVARAFSGSPQVLLVRDPSRAPALSGAEVRQSSYDDPRESVLGIRTLFMVSAAEHPDRVGQHRRFIDAAAAAGVEHVVYTSFYGAAPDATFTLARDHWATEEHLKTSGMAWTFLRDQIYADFFPLMAEDGVIRGPAGEGAVAAVAIADVAAAAVAVLGDPEVYQGKAFDLTGPEAITLSDVAQVLSEHGRPTRFHDETVEEAYASRARYGAPDWQVEAWVSTYQAIRDGSMSGVSQDVETLTGRPLSLAELLDQS
ncbi:MAG: Nucleoside-diphosphate sugar epimerase [Frankiales bacterium]|nr:Nucleoside-diphosphate sugar epimerase [Frankiales bacterium]